VGSGLVGSGQMGGNLKFSVAFLTEKKKFKKIEVMVTMMMTMMKML
jgi:hypothetical protein